MVQERKMVQQRKKEKKDKKYILFYSLSVAM